uniref:Nucleoside diphosphate kinase homolog 5 n=1 Tax=Phallusia mammillata TaxID=59560 RepID=A0A6F9DN06_9ASCI|nr:NDK/DPY26 [Phallusia mammillata]
MLSLSNRGIKTKINFHWATEFTFYCRKYSISGGSSSISDEDNKERMEIKMKPPQIYVERTLAIIKPDAMNKAAEIEDIILRNGFTILQKRKVHLSPEQASDFYVEHYGKMFFPSLVAYMSSSPITVYVLAKDKAISAWRELIGPTNPFKARETHPGCLRDTYGKDQTRNAVHGSDSFISAQREIRFMFHDNVIEPIAAGQECKDYLSGEVNATLLKGLTELCKKKPGDPVTWLADWLIDNNPNKPSVKGPVVVEED